jgi:PAS domain S-box-containing protein
MNQVPRLLQFLSDARIGALFGSSRPAFVFDREGTLLFLNGAALGLLRARSRTEAAAALEPSRGPFAATIREVLKTPPDGPAQSQTLPVPSAGSRKAIQFSAAHVALAGGASIVIFTGTEPAADVLGAGVAAATVFDDQKEALALFDAGGNRVFANEAAAALMGNAASLTELVPSARDALAKARSDGTAELSFGVLRVTLNRIGADINAFVVATFAAPTRAPVEYDTNAEPEWTDATPAHAEVPEVREVKSEQAATEILAPPVTQAEAPKAEPSPETTAAEEKPKHADVAKPTEPEPKKQPPRMPSRFVWQTDANGYFTSVSPELALVVGKEFAAIAGINWREAGEAFDIDGVDAVVAAVERRDTWSGVSVNWPVSGSELVRPVDLAALPVYDRERRFLGYRGFGVFRDAIPRPVRAETPAPPKEETRGEPPASNSALPREFLRPDESQPVFGKRVNVVPLHKSASEPRPSLTPIERNAFREIARAISTRMQRDEKAERGRDQDAKLPPAARAPVPAAPHAPAITGERAVLDRLPVGVIVHRADVILYANRTLLDWLGVASTEDLEMAGGLDRLFSGGQAFGPAEEGGAPRPIAIRGRSGEPIPVEARLLSSPWDGDPALVYVLRRAGAGIDERMEAGELALRDAEATAREMRAILDTATDGVALIDRAGNILGINRSAEALFGFDSAELEGRSFTTLFAPESHRAAADYLDGLAMNGVASVLNDGREVIGRVREGGLIPLFMTLGRLGDGVEKFCAVFRDITQWKRAEEELVHARRNAERANSAKSEFLAKISHEIRTPLNAIIGFAEVMMEERLGPIGNDRYREYLKDIHTSGEHLISLINDLLDLSKIEAGKLDLVFSSVDLNEIASQSMALMQPQANRERIIIRTALSNNLPPVVADARSIRQIVLNLLSNSIRFTPPGGQVIVSTTLTDDGEVHLRVRDTGIGMSETDIQTALEPFRQITTSGRGKAGGTGLGLPLTKALVEANRASFAIKSTVNAGTLVEIAFPSTRVLAE